jgi:hypothetical protein
MAADSDETRSVCSGKSKSIQHVQLGHGKDRSAYMLWQQSLVILLSLGVQLLCGSTKLCAHRAFLTNAFQLTGVVRSYAGV